MPVEQEATPKPRTRRKAAGDGLSSLSDLTAPDDVDAPTPLDPNLKKILYAVEKLQDSINVLDDRANMIGVAVSGSKPTSGESALKTQQQLVEKVDLLIEVFRLYLHLTTEADRSTRQRVRMIRKVLDRYMARHDKTEAKRKPATWTNIGLLAVGSILAIIGVVSVIGWVFE